ncbi:MAG: metal ABC transporter substrate-binding protein [Methylobacteriaceae bacterium]|nr:metal ABC transporter substrate-binding protein [Methylobacteriaceae bacterium]
MIDRRCLLFSAAALAAPRALAQSPGKLSVLASFTILADLVGAVGGDRLAVTAMVGPGGDAHVFQPAPTDAKRVADARLVVINGLHFEGWMERLIEASGAKPRVVVASEGVKPRDNPDLHDDHGHKKQDRHGHSHAVDPHAWQSAQNVKIYVGNIARALAAADPEGAAVYAANAQAYGRELEALDAEIRAAVATLPQARRKVVTTHDAFGYFADAYGLQFIAPKGVSSQTEASARDVARIIRQIRTEKIPAVFLENISDPRQMQRIAQETGARIGGALFSDSLTAPDGPAPTYIAMMRHNIRELTKALAA